MSESDDMINKLIEEAFDKFVNETEDAYSWGAETMFEAGARWALEYVKKPIDELRSLASAAHLGEMADDILYEHQLRQREEEE